MVLHHLFTLIAVVYIDHPLPVSRCETMLLLVSILLAAFFLCEFTVTVNKGCNLPNPVGAQSFPSVLAPMENKFQKW